MKPAYFADSFYFLAVLNKEDAAHARAQEFAHRQDMTLYTAWPVLTELGDALVSGYSRQRVTGFADRLLADPEVVVVPPSEEQYRAGLKLFAARPDKSWSLTDCVSFVVMEELCLTEALTGDKQFVQAGFTALLRE